MIPEYRLAGYEEPVARATENRMVDSSGRTLLALPKRSQLDPIVISAKTGWSKQTEDFDIYFLEGDCCVRQGNNSVQGPLAVVWVSRRDGDPLSVGADRGLREVTIYLEGTADEQLSLEFSVDQEIDATIRDRQWFGRFITRTTIQTLVMNPEPSRVREPGIYHRAMEMMSPDYSVIQQAQYVVESSSTNSPASSTPPRFRRISLLPRGDNDQMSMRLEPYPNNPERGIAVITKGLNLIIEGVTGEDLLMGDIVDISADHAVIWTNSLTKIRENNDIKEESNLDFELYLEGNIIFRDGERTIEANRMYYDAKNRIAYILDGRLSTPLVGIKNITGSIRVKAEIIQKLGDGMFSAKNTLVTTSQLGEPTYSLRSRTMTLTERFASARWGEEEPRKQQILVAEGNYLAARNIPVFYWPWMAADLKDPTFYIKNISYGHSDQFGNQIRTRWNPFQVLGIRNRPSWLDGDVFIAWMEKRGISHGAHFSYSPSSSCGLPGPTDGLIQYWGLYDKGETDRLGGARSKVPFPDMYRYRLRWIHRQKLESLCTWKGDWDFTARVGKASDRNVLNSYFMNEWNQRDNDTTSVELKRKDGNSTTSLSTEYALDDFYTNSNRLPRLDHYLSGQSLFGDRLTWYEHTRVGYVNYDTAQSPYAPDMTAWNQDARYFNYLPWELTPWSTTNQPARPGTTDADPETINTSFEVFSTRHELDMPFNVGPVRCVPYVLGDFSHWGSDRSGNDVQRLYGQTGLRLNLPFWKVQPNCSSRTWYVNGLAHKIDLDAELSYARSNRDMDNLILTDALDNWSVEDFRRRYSVTTFGQYGSIPYRFDPRYYAIRSGMGGNVSAGNMELADDLTLCRFGVTQRWQTKRGPAGKRYIIDWITLAVNFNYYPEKEQNFGESVGLIDYNFLWHVGDRFSLFSSGLYDTFSDGQRITRIGGVWNRPNRGNLGVMLDQMEGAIERTYLTLNLGYTMNEKYSMSYTTSYEIKHKWENVGHNFMFTRTGEAFRLLVGASYSEARRDWSFTFGIEPVFMRGIASKMAQASNTITQSNR